MSDNVRARFRDQRHGQRPRRPQGVIDKLLGVVPKRVVCKGIFGQAKDRLGVSGLFVTD